MPPPTTQSTPTPKNLSDSSEDQDDYVETSKFSGAERVVNQAIHFLVTVRSGMHTKLPVGISSRDSFVYSSMQLALVSAPRGFYGFLTSMEALQDHLRQLFDDSKKGRTAYRDAQCFLTELLGDFKRTLAHAKTSMGGEYAVELLFHPWENKVMSEDLEYFDPLGLLRTAVENNTATHYKNLQKLQAQASAQRAFASSAAPAPFAGHGQARLPPPPPGLNVPKSGKNFFYHIRKTGRFPLRDGSCVLCGKGEEPGSQGHRAEVCGRVENTLSPDYARFHASMPRPEGPRHSLRSGSRSDSLRGSVTPAVLKCTIAPGIWPKGTRARPRFSSALLSPSPSSSPPAPPGARPARADGGRSG